MKFRSYRMTDDVGHAPCIFDSLENLMRVKQNNFRDVSSKILTLSNCGYSIRKGAEPEDYVFGIAGNIFESQINKLIWVAKVQEIISKEEYFKKFGNNNYNAKSRPDNFYEKKGGIWLQHSNPFHPKECTEADTRIDRVLLSKEFWYFGEKAIEIPENLRCIHRLKNINPEEAEQFIEGIRKSYPIGANGIPIEIRSIRRKLQYFVKAHAPQ